MPDACVGSAVGPSSHPLGLGWAGGFLSLLGWVECSRDVDFLAFFFFENDWLLELLSVEYFTRTWAVMAAHAE